MHNTSFKFSRLRCSAVMVGALLTLLQCVSIGEVAAQSSVREVNTKRQTPSFFRRPFAALAGSSLESDTDESALVNDSFFVEYEAQLNAILKTRLDAEKEFVKGLVEQVRAENISTRLVNTSFKWVRNKRPNVKNSFIYFERVLRILATSQGVGQFIPEFDANVYSLTSTGTLP